VLDASIRVSDAGVIPQSINPPQQTATDQLGDLKPFNERIKEGS
jgi:hypothetical protein